MKIEIFKLSNPQIFKLRKLLRKLQINFSPCYQRCTHKESCGKQIHASIEMLHTAKAYRYHYRKRQQIQTGIIQVALMTEKQQRERH
jgi:hypothetical protein